METTIASSGSRVSDLTQTALVAALYVVVTVILAVISFGAVQLRLSEMFNYLALFNKRYVFAVTLGVVLANFYSPTWIIDVPLGGFATLLVLLLCRSLTKNIQSIALKFVITGILFTVSMVTVAGQLTIVLGLPFWPTYALVAIGEALSMAVGGITIYMLNKKINFSK